MLENLKHYLFSVPFFQPLLLITLLLLLGLRLTHLGKTLCFLGSLLLLQIWFYSVASPTGTDLSIFIYNADLFLSGVDVFGPERLAYVTPGRLVTAATYLDYTPLQFATYAGGEWLSKKIYLSMNPIWGWSLVHFCALLVTIAAAFIYHTRQKERNYTSIASKAVMLITSPLAWDMTYLNYWTEKWYYLAFPTLLLAVWQQWVLAALVIGLGIGYNASLALVAPAWLWWLYRQKGLKYALIAGALLGVTAAASVLILGPDALIIYKNRSARIFSYEPAAFAFISLLPKALYSPQLLNVLQTLCAAGCLLLVHKYKQYRWAAVLSVWGLLLISPGNNMPRMMISGMLIPFTQPRGTNNYYLIQWCILMLICALPANPIGSTLMTHGIIAALGVVDYLYGKGYYPGLFGTEVVAKTEVVPSRAV